MVNSLSGLSTSTPDFLVFDAGVIYANIDISELENPAGGWEAAIAAAVLLGATRGGATFNANRELRDVDVNGTLGPVRGLKYRNMIRPTLTATFIEMKTENLRIAMNAVAAEVGKFDKITGAEIGDASYLENVAIAAMQGIKEEPVVFVLRNVLVETSPDFSFEEHNEVSTEMEFVGHFPLSAPRDEAQVWGAYVPTEES